MHPLHDYFAKQLADKLTRRGVVVWYDPRREFTPLALVEHQPHRPGLELIGELPALALPAFVGRSMLASQSTNSIAPLSTKCSRCFDWPSR